MFRNLFNRVFWTFASIWAVVSFLAVTITYSFVQASAHYGEVAWGWDYYADGLSDLFGDVVSLILLLVALVVIGVAVWLAGWFARNGYARANQLWYVIGLVVGTFLLSRVDWSSFGFGWTPVVIMIAFVLIMAIISRKIPDWLNRRPATTPTPAT